MIELAGGASTNSRASRPLPRDATSAVTVHVDGMREKTIFYFPGGVAEVVDLLSWVGGQSGLLWGGGPWPFDMPVDVSGSYGHIEEHKLAETLGEVFDGYLSSSDMAVRFFQNGGDACAAAARIARAVTGRDDIAAQGYHGAQTDFAHQPAWYGYPYPNVEMHRRFEFGNGDMMRREVSNRAACIMVEVPGLDDEEEISVFLTHCRYTADKNSIPFIIDDVVGGFRFDLAGTSERYGVKPDMVCLGKAMSATGGISALIGRRDLVGELGGGKVFYSTTFGGSPDRCAIANASIRWLMEHKAEVYGTGGHLQHIGRMLKDGLIARGVPCVGQPERSAFAFKTDAEWLSFCQRMIENGVMVHRPNFITLAHTEADVSETLDAVDEVMKEIRTA